MSSDVLVVGQVPESVRAAVAGVVKALEQAFNDKDPVALSEQFAERTSWSNAIGIRLDDRKAIAEFSGPAMKSFLRDSYARYEIVKLLELAPRVIAVNVVQTPTDAAGETVDGPRGATLYVIAEQPDGWKIVVGQNTAVDAPAG
ncbi:SgcJ/EcaC family oxidoreductase [Streptomyces qinzhouensis]|uniref:SgcJ/EcaC family oxidoreductase n=1 Tax=Streptomyces qinzhouensis TaxID=2599401 RepID=A0A5B8JA84_9ACTN|nr:SgcJ/EcaC family oxidoreductase [Streptomyces qinzhouensis]QDY78246.1 SgcJ/EcaC family oxidoreductase [Streptomyces qinzhouensis]